MQAAAWAAAHWPGAAAPVSHPGSNSRLRRLASTPRSYCGASRPPETMTSEGRSAWPAKLRARISRTPAA